MAVELPEPLQWVLLLLAGTRWPEADEDQLRAMADHWRKTADGIEHAAQTADTAMKNALDGQKGTGAEAAAQGWAKFTTGKGTEDDPGYFPGTVKACRGMGDMLEAMANSAETAKIQIVAQLGILAFEIATAEAEAVGTAGLSLLEIPAMIAAGKATIGGILKKLLQEVAMHALKMAVQMGAINLMAQTIELAEGHRKSIDTKELGDSFKGGALSGAFGNVLGKGLGAAGGKLLGKGMDSLGAKMAHGAATGVGTDVLTQLTLTGKVDSGSLLGSGLSGGAGVGLHAGAQGVRDHFNGPPKFAPEHGIGDPVPPGEGGRQDGPPPSTPHGEIGDPVPSGSGGRQDGPPSSSEGSSDNSTYHGPDGASGGGEHSNNLAPFGSDRPSSSSGGGSDLGSNRPSEQPSHEQASHEQASHEQPSHENPPSEQQSHDRQSQDGQDDRRLSAKEAAKAEGLDYLDVDDDPHESTAGRHDGQHTPAPEPVAHEPSNQEHVAPSYDETSHGGPEAQPPHEQAGPRPEEHANPDVQQPSHESPSHEQQSHDDDGPLEYLNVDGPNHEETVAAPHEQPSHEQPSTHQPAPESVTHEAPEYVPASGPHESSGSSSDGPAPSSGSHSGGGAVPTNPLAGAHLGTGANPTTHIDGGTRVSSAPPRQSPAPGDHVTPDGAVPPTAEAPANSGQQASVPPQFGPVPPAGSVPHGSSGTGGGNHTAPRPETTGPKPEASAPRPRTEPGTEAGGSRFRTQEQRRREQEQEQRRHEFATREHTTPETPVEPKRDVPTMGQEERLHTLGNLKPEERRKLATDKEFVAELRKHSTPDEFAQSAAHLLVEVDPRTVQGGASRHEAQQQLARMLRNPDVAERMLRNGVEVVVVPKDVRMTDVPAFDRLKGKGAEGESGLGRSWDDIRGVSDRKKVAITEENLLGEKTTIGRTGSFADGYSSTTHEFAHAIHKYGLSPSEKQLITESFNNKRRNDSDRTAEWADGPRQDTRGRDKENYSSTDEKEYFAQVTNSYLSTNHGKDALTGQDRNNGSHWAGQHEQALHPLLEQLYGKDPLAAHTGGRANPVHHTEAVSGVGDFFRMAEGQHETPLHEAPDHESQPHENEPRENEPHEGRPHEGRPHEDADSSDGPSPAPPTSTPRPELAEVPAGKRQEMLDWAFKEQTKTKLEDWQHTGDEQPPTVKIPLENGSHLVVSERGADGRYPVSEHTPQFEEVAPPKGGKSGKKGGQQAPERRPALDENGQQKFTVRELEPKTVDELFEGNRRPETAHPTDVNLKRQDEKLVETIDHKSKNGTTEKLYMHFDQEEHSFSHYSFAKGSKPGEEVGSHMTVDNALATLFAKLGPPDGRPRTHDNASQFLNHRAESQSTDAPLDKSHYNGILTGEHHLAEVDNMHFYVSDPKGKKPKGSRDPGVNLKEFNDFVDVSLEHLGASKELRDVISGSAERVAAGGEIAHPDGKPNPPLRPGHVRRELTDMIADEDQKPEFARFAALVTDRTGAREVPPLLGKLMRDHNDTIGLTREEFNQLDLKKVPEASRTAAQEHFDAADARLAKANEELAAAKKDAQTAAANAKKFTKGTPEFVEPFQKFKTAEKAFNEAKARADAAAQDMEYHFTAGNGTDQVHQAIAEHHWDTVKEWIRDPLNTRSEESSSSPGDDEPSAAPPGDDDLPSPAPPGEGEPVNERSGERSALEKAGLDLRGEPDRVLERLEQRFGAPDAGSADRVREVLGSGGNFDQVLGAHLGHELHSDGSGELVHAMQNGASADTVKYLFGGAERTPEVDRQLGSHPDWVEPREMGRWLMGSSMQDRNGPMVRLNEGLAHGEHGGGSLLYLGGDADIEHALFTTGTKDLTIVSTDPNVPDRTQFLQSTGAVIKQKLERYGPDHKVTVEPIGQDGTHFSVTDANNNRVMDVRYHAQTYDEFLKGSGPGADRKFDFLMEKDSWFGEWRDASGARLSQSDIVHRVGDSLKDGGHWIGGFEPGASAGTDRLFHDRTGEFTTHDRTHWGGQEYLHVRQRQDQAELPHTQPDDPGVLNAYDIADSVLNGHPNVTDMPVADFHQSIVKSVAEDALAYLEPEDRHTGPVAERLADWFAGHGNPRPDPAAIRDVLDRALAQADNPSPAPPTAPEEIHLDGSHPGGDDLPSPPPPGHREEAGPQQHEDQPSPPPPAGQGQELRFGPVRPEHTEHGTPHAEPEPEPEQGSRKRGAEGEPEAKFRRTEAYERTTLVREQRGLKPPTPEQRQAVEQLTGRQPFPEPTEKLLKAVNPHEQSLDGSSLHSCLEAAEALRDTHYGRPRPSDVPLTDRPEADAAWTLLKRAEPPRSFGDGKHGIEALVRQVEEGGPGTFSTVLLGKQGKEGHALTLIHGQDGVLRWADPSTGTVRTVHEQPIPPRFGNSDHVWAATTGPHEEHVPGGVHDPAMFGEDAPEFGMAKKDKQKKDEEAFTPYVAGDPVAEQRMQDVETAMKQGLKGRPLGLGGKDGTRYTREDIPGGDPAPMYRAMTRAEFEGLATASFKQGPAFQGFSPTQEYSEGYITNKSRETHLIALYRPDFVPGGETRPSVGDIFLANGGREKNEDGITSIGVGRTAGFSAEVKGAQKELDGWTEKLATAQKAVTTAEADLAKADPKFRKPIENRLKKANDAVLEAQGKIDGLQGEPLPDSAISELNAAIARGDIAWQLMTLRQ
ncbi:toxin glutamine deamidase domain-containing protein [Kitasatospora sp. NPDC002227]|uniref:WXG100-like domain-containing protein n=1 Tax=Kitasatospora sp. NPDC002227 TaxID=3154773 RepID=UPI0033244B57